MDNKTILEEVGIEVSRELENKANKDLSNVTQLPENIIEQLKGKDGKQGTRGDKGSKGDKGNAGTNANLKITYGEARTNGWDYWVYPPSGYNMSHLKGFTCSLAIIYFCGGVDCNDTLQTRWNKESNRVKIHCNNSENRSASYVNYFAIWEK
jgi:hypothetical protein